MTCQHEKTELTIFRAFAKICPLPIQFDSIQKMCPPKPDIECAISGDGLIAFELVEIIDQNFANLFAKQNDTKKSISEFHSKLPKEKKKHFDGKYSNAMIFPQFKNASTFRQREKIFPVIFDHLLKIDKQFEGDTFKNLNGELWDISISRGTFNGPLFDLSFAGSI